MLDAFNKKGIALCKMHILADNTEDAKTLMDEIKKTVIEVSKLAELTDTKVSLSALLPDKNYHYQLFNNILFSGVAFCSMAQRRNGSVRSLDQVPQQNTGRSSDQRSRRETHQVLRGAGLGTRGCLRRERSTTQIPNGL